MSLRTRRQCAARRTALACLIAMAGGADTARADESGLTLQAPANVQVRIREAHKPWQDEPVETIEPALKLLPPKDQTAESKADEPQAEPASVEKSQPKSVAASSIKLRPLNLAPARPSATVEKLVPAKPVNQREARPGPLSLDAPAAASQPKPINGLPPSLRTESDRGLDSPANDSSSRKPSAPVQRPAPVQRNVQRGVVPNAGVDPDSNWVAREAINRIAPLTDPVARSRQPSAPIATTPAAPSADRFRPMPAVTKPELAKPDLAEPDVANETTVSPQDSTPSADLETQPKLERDTSSDQLRPVPSLGDPSADVQVKETQRDVASETQATTKKPAETADEPVASSSNARGITVRSLKIDRSGRHTESVHPDYQRPSADADQKMAVAPRRVDRRSDDSSESPRIARSTQQKTSPGLTEANVKDLDAHDSKAASPQADQQDKSPSVASAAPSDVDEVPQVELDYTGNPKQDFGLTRTAASMKGRIAGVLKYFYDRPEIADGRSNWGMIHAMLVYGPDTKVRVGKKHYSTIAWVAGNNICRGQRLLVDGPNGIEATNGVGLQGHDGQFLMTLGLSGVPDTYPLYASGKKYTVADLVQREAKSCKPGTELTFIMIGLLHYMSTDATWVSDDGQRWDFERLLAEELSQPIVGQACGGTHRLMGFAHALRKRRAEGLPITGQWRRADKFVQDFMAYTYKLQNRDGSFSTDWFSGREDNGDLDRKIQTTGHMTEWLLTATPDHEIQNPRLLAAVRFLATEIGNEPQREWSIGPKGHALRSLAMFYDRVYREGPAWRHGGVARSNNGSTHRRYRR
ncbi:hypothetical protein V7x_53720 [Crateriforma conspicua]|uniref:Prenyltransferase and squalene oxidase repeat protein n=1 Tax=Crateriforma conspicua TaxID=2527996 RepID=A0A5C6FJV3_9PLAN|nr:hypothetical protein [Crateriforma conspicua]TWU61060.1 hypothetical protein V7x_53720 [Crateriforma conspicua]